MQWRVAAPLFSLWVLAYLAWWYRFRVGDVSSFSLALQGSATGAESPGNATEAKIDSPAAPCSSLSEFWRDRFAASSDEYHAMQENAKLLTQGTWKSKTFHSKLVSINRTAGITEIVGGQRVFIVGDSYAREKHKTLVRLISNELGIPFDSKYKLGEVEGTREMRHTSLSLDPDTPGCAHHLKDPTGCAGVNIKRCGRPGSDNATLTSIHAVLNFQFKTYLSTPAADKLTIRDIALLDPQVVVVDVGRWVQAPKSCQRQRAPREELVEFLKLLNSTVLRLVIVLSSGDEGVMFEHELVQQTIETCRFLFIT